MLLWFSVADKVVAVVIVMLTVAVGFAIVGFVVSLVFFYYYYCQCCF